MSHGQQQSSVTRGHERGRCARQPMRSPAQRTVARRCSHALAAHLRPIWSDMLAPPRASRHSFDANTSLQSWSEHRLRYVHRGGGVSRPDMCTTISAVTRNHAHGEREANVALNIHGFRRGSGFRRGFVAETLETLFSYLQRPQAHQCCPCLPSLDVLPIRGPAVELGSRTPSTAFA